MWNYTDVYTLRCLFIVEMLQTILKSVWLVISVQDIGWWVTNLSLAVLLTSDKKKKKKKKEQHQSTSEIFLSWFVLSPNWLQQ